MSIQHMQNKLLAYVFKFVSEAMRTKNTKKMVHPSVENTKNVNATYKTRSIILYQVIRLHKMQQQLECSVT